MSYLKYFWLNFKSIILNVHIDPCFEDKLSSLTLKYWAVHFSESSCIYETIQSAFLNDLVDFTENLVGEGTIFSTGRKHS